MLPLRGSALAVADYAATPYQLHGNFAMRLKRYERNAVQCAQSAAIFIPE